jgi:glycosyltransferase involved in cell wall biosynthesis
MTGLRFCYLTTFYPPYSFGGDAIGIQRFARGLVRLGHHVTVIHDLDAFHALHEGPDPTVANGRTDGVEVIGLHSALGRLSSVLTHQLGRPVVNGRRIQEILRRGAYDVLNFHNVSLLGGPGLLRFRSRAVTLYMAHEHWLVCPTHVLWRHGRELCTGRECMRCMLHYRRPPQLWRYTDYLARAIKEVDAVIALSEFSRRKHLEFGFPRDMEVLPPFLPDPETRVPVAADGVSPHSRPYFFFAGRLEHIKGVDDLIRAFRTYAEADLLIAGDGEQAETLRASAAEMPNVVFLGKVDQSAMNRYFRHAIATVVPSHGFETFGLVIIESFGQGTPVIARRLGPFPDILNESGGGELFETNDQLLAAMQRMQSNAAYREQLGASGYRAYVANWSEGVVLPRYLKIVERAALRRGHQRVIDILRTAEAA